MLNTVVLTGRLVREPEVQYVGDGEVAKCTVTLAVQRNFKNSKGEREADFIPVVFWRGAAEAVGKYLTKGSLIGVTGRLESYSFDGNGGTVRGLRVVAEDFTFLEPRAQAQNGDDEEVEEAPKKPAQKQATAKSSAAAKTAGKTTTAKATKKAVPF